MPSELLQVALALVPALVNAIAGALHAGDVEALEGLRRVCPTPEVIALVDEALQKAQRAKAAAELGQ